MALLLLLLGCPDREPVVRGVKPRDVEAVEAERVERTRHTDPTAVELVYQRAPGVYVDVRYLAGREYPRVRDEIMAQLGALRSDEPQDDGGRRIRLERGELELDRDDVIVMIDVPLPEPMRRTEALNALGFPGEVSAWHTFSGEYRLYNVWTVARMRLLRTAPDSEDVDRVQAWAALPKGR